MAAEPSSETKKDNSSPPAPEVLKPQEEKASEPSEKVESKAAPPHKSHNRLRYGTHRPSHKATFIGLAVVLAVLAVNVGVIGLIMKSQNGKNNSKLQEGISISSDALSNLGVNRNNIGNKGVELIVGPNSRFNGKVRVGGDVSIAGQLLLNSKFSASDASLAKLNAGNTSLSRLNVNGDGTASTLNLRKNLNVAGTTRLQGAVTVSQLMTVNNNLNVAGSLAVGGTISARNFQASALSVSTLRIGGHIITHGSAPGVSRGPAIGNNGSVSISGSDVAGTVAINAGTGAGGGVLANIYFNQPYGGTPRVVATFVGRGASGSLYVNRNSSGFSVGVNGSLPPGGYAIDFIVMQ